MLQRRRDAFLLAVLVPIGVFLGFAPVFAAEDIGRVKVVVFSAYGTPPAERRQTLYVRDDIFTNEVVETRKRSALHLSFLDDSIFRLGAESRATLDRFIYDPASKTGELTINLKEGIFRFKTGKMKKEGIRVVTPVAVITVSGTDFIVQVLANFIRVAVLEGAINISPSAAAAPVSLAAPATAQVGSGGGVTPNVAPAADPGLDEGAGVGDNEGPGGGSGGSESSSDGSSNGGDGDNEGTGNGSGDSSGSGGSKD